MQSPPFLILAIFGFPLNTPLPARHVRSPLTTAQRAPCQKRGFGKARYQVAREARFRATQNATLSKNATSRFDFWFADNDMMLNSAASTRPPFRLSLESKAHRKARLFHTSGEMVPPQYSPSHAARSLTAHDRAKCPRRRARSFDEGIIVSRPNAVGRDGYLSYLSLLRTDWFNRTAKYRASDFRRFCAVWNAAYLPVCKRHTAQKGENEPPET